MTAQSDHIGRRQGFHPLSIEANLRFLRIENLEDLFGIGVRVGFDLFAGQRFASFRPASRIADHAGEIPDQKDHNMPQLLKLAQFIEHNSMAEMQIWR